MPADYDCMTYDYNMTYDLSEVLVDLMPTDYDNMTYDNNMTYVTTI